MVCSRKQPGSGCAPDGPGPHAREEACRHGPRCPSGQSASALAAILEGIGAATVTVDPATMAVVDLNPVAERLLALERGQWLGRPYEEAVGARLSSLGPMVPAGPPGPDGRRPPMSGEFLYARPDKTLVPLSRTVLMESPESGGHIVEVLFDISAKKAMERQLGLAQKLESIGQLASGIAHEINTPIQYVSGNLGFLQEAFRDLSGVVARYDAAVAASSCDPGLRLELEEAKARARWDTLLAEIPESIADSLAGVERVAAIVGAMKRFSHPESAGRRLLDVNKAVESTITISRNEWKYHSDLRSELDPTLPLLFCSPGDFNQAVLNVVVNAAHAVSEKHRDTGGKGLITVRTFQECGLEAGREDFICVSVSDTGVGIPKDNLDRIFDPFFTTKEVGKGTGQGLAIVHSVVTRHGGTVSIDSKPGSGTTFTLRFPLRQDKP